MTPDFTLAATGPAARRARLLSAPRPPHLPRLGLGEPDPRAGRAGQQAPIPETPCGFVGGQAPNIWGGYDYAKLAKAIQFIEAYDLGSAQEILRSFNPGNAWAQVTTHFHNDKLGVESTTSGRAGTTSPTATGG